MFSIQERRPRCWHRIALRSALALASISALHACKKNKNPTPKAQTDEKRELPKCEPQKKHPGLAPEVRPEMQRAEFWLDKIGKGRATTTLLLPADILKLNEAIRSQELGVRTLPQELGEDAQKKQSTAFHQEQQAFVQEKLDTNKYVESKPGAKARGDQLVQALLARDDYFAFRINTQLRCWPIEGGLFKPPIDPDFDRNNCTTLQPPSLVHRIASTKEDDWHYVQGEFVEGWVQHPQWLAISKKEIQKQRRLPKRWITEDKTPVQRKDSRAAHLSMGSVIRVGPQDTLAWPDKKGWNKLKLPKRKSTLREALPFRRDHIFALAFAQLGRPYGWGGRDAERDCSRLLLDLFHNFGVHLPRWSGHQAQIANSVDVSMLSSKDKRATIRRFSESNLLLLYMPGHIMLYLGHDGERDYAISSISEFVTPCEDPQSGELSEQIHRLDRVAVTDLSLGKGAPRRSFLERITRMVRL